MITIMRPRKEQHLNKIPTTDKKGIPLNLKPYFNKIAEEYFVSSNNLRSH